MCLSPLDKSGGKPLGLHHLKKYLFYLLHQFLATTSRENMLGGVENKLCSTFLLHEPMQLWSKPLNHLWHKSVKQMLRSRTDLKLLGFSNLASNVAGHCSIQILTLHLYCLPIFFVHMVFAWWNFSVVNLPYLLVSRVWSGSRALKPSNPLWGWSQSNYTKTKCKEKEKKKKSDNPKLLSTKFT